MLGLRFIRLQFFLQMSQAKMNIFFYGFMHSSIYFKLNFNTIRLRISNISSLLIEILHSFHCFLLSCIHFEVNQVLLFYLKKNNKKIIHHKKSKYLTINNKKYNSNNTKKI